MNRTWDNKLSQSQKDKMSDYRIGLMMDCIGDAQYYIDGLQEELEMDLNDEGDALNGMRQYLAELKEELAYEQRQRERGRLIMRSRRMQ